MLVFRSVIVSLKAALVNVLSIGGAYGVLVAVFLWAWLKDLFGLEGRCRSPRKGSFITFFAPQAVSQTGALDINDRRQIVGIYR